MVRRRANAAGIATRIGNHSFRATGITTYLMNGATLENAAAMTNHASSRTTQLYEGATRSASTSSSRSKFDGVLINMSNLAIRIIVTLKGKECRSIPFGNPRRRCAIQGYSGRPSFSCSLRKARQISHDLRRLKAELVGPFLQ
jgi:hypothetical protein